MDVTGDLNSSNPYLTNDRVGAIRVTYSNGGNSNTYMESYPNSYSAYADIYTDLSSMKEWEQIKDKFYFYTVDEPMSQEQQDAIADIADTSGHTIDDVKKTSEYLAKYWPDAATVVPYHENHPYPYYTYTDKIANLDAAIIKDATQEMIDTASCTVWCPDIFGLTPLAELEANGYNGVNFVGKIRGFSATISGNILMSEPYYNWEALYGDFSDRVLSNNIIRNRDGQNNDRMWAYTAGWGNSYTYCHHMIEHTGLQTKMLFWQLFQEDATGYLYYDVNKWSVDYVDNTVTGNRTGKWKVNAKNTAQGYTTYSSGILFYQAIQGGFTNGLEYVGSIRIEMIRDGIEEYQMLTMLEDLRGSEAADAIVESVSKNVVNYLSLPGFDRSAFDSKLDDYDVMAMVRIELGNQLEAASRDVCEHDYDDGTVTLEPTCLVMGEMTYTCRKCGAVDTEHIPTLHAEGDCFNITVENETTCTADGKYRYECTICGYAKYVTEQAFHKNSDYLIYEPHATITAYHNVICAVCKKTITQASHTTVAVYTNTCTEAGVLNQVCNLCGYTKYISDVEAKGHYLEETETKATCQSEGYIKSSCYNCDYTYEAVLEITDHNYVNGYCTECGESDGSVIIGDIDGDGDVTMLDLYKLKLFLKQAAEPNDKEITSADIDGDGDITMLDSYALRFRVSTGYWKD